MLCKDETICAPVGVGFHMQVVPKMPGGGDGDGDMSQGQDGGDEETPHTAASGWGGPGGMDGGWGWRNAGTRVGGDIGMGWVYGTMMMGLIVGGELF